jgi:hypothetical protein
MKLRSKIFYSYVILVIIYALLTILPEPAKATLSKYHLHPTGVRLLDITIIIPVAVIWFAVFYGYSRLHAYGQLIKANHDGKQIVSLADGLLAFAFGFPVTTIISALLQLIARHHPGFTAISVVISNYLGVVYSLIAFLLINRAARGLGELTKTRPGPVALNFVTLTVIVLGVVFCDLIASAHHGIRTTYHMSYSLVMLTIAIPYMYIWFLGLFAIAEMYVYSKQVVGILYRKGWDRLMFGLGVVIITNILLQYLGTLSTWVNRLSLNGILLLLYVLLLGLAAGFIVVALGTKELMRIEEV